jgi:protein required for attachment to host cells
VKPVCTWILIADGGSGRIFANYGPGKGITHVRDLTLDVPIKATRDIMADKPGRSFESANTARHSMEYRSDPHREQKKQFLRQIAELLSANINDFDRLIVIAAPTALGDLRHMLSANVRAKITAERDKDLTHLKAVDIPDHLEDILPV